jgi:histone-lysine N-methyltransferase SUV39H
MASIIRSFTDYILYQPEPSLPNGFLKITSVTSQKLGDLGPTFSSPLVVSPATNKRKSSELDDSKHTLRPPITPPQPRIPEGNQHFIVEIPSPSLSLDQYVKVQPKHDGLSEKYYPVESIERSKAFDRRYPYKRTVKRSLVPLSADIGDQHGRDFRSEDLETIQRASLTHSLSRLQADGPEVFFNIEKQNLFLLAASNFGFVKDYILRDNVQPVPEAFNSGCECAGGACEPDKCSCLATEEDSEELIVPYQLGKMALDPHFLKRKSMIYECNHRCGCRGNCRFNVTQRGRRFRLEIFHTGNRGFGELPPLNLTSQLKVHYIDNLLTNQLFRSSFPR